VASVVAAASAPPEKARREIFEDVIVSSLADQSF
jgi:hypothetical protein